MSNKRISQLVQIVPAGVANDDLLAIADISVPETKKMTMGDFATWVGTSASIAIDSASYTKTASYLLYGSPSTINGTASFSISSSWANLAYSSSFVISASSATTSSWARSASFFVGSVSGAFTATNANTASYLKYSTGANTGTASFAITASRAINANTASYISTANLSGSSVASASYSYTASLVLGSYTVTSASRASWSTQSINALTASYLDYTIMGIAKTGRIYSASLADKATYTTTASFAQDYIPINVYKFNGPYTSSYGVNQHHTHSWMVTTGTGKTCSFTPWPGHGSEPIYFSVAGGVIVPYSGSTNIDCFVSMSIWQTDGGAQLTLDKQWFHFRNNNANTETGSLRMPFTLNGYSGSLSGSYCVYVGTNKCIFDATRSMTWTIQSKHYTIATIA